MPLTNPTKINISAGATSNNLSAVTFSNSNGVSFGITGSTITGSIATQSNQTLGLYAVGNTTGASSSSTFDARTLSYNGLGAATMGFSNGSVQVSAPNTSSLSATGAVNLTVNGSTISIGAQLNISAGTTSNNLTSQFVFSNNSNVSFGLNGSTITAQIPTLNAFEPFAIITGSSVQSENPASVLFNRIIVPHQLAISNVNLVKSVNVGILAGTSANSSGTERHSYSHGVTLFSRQDFGANSTNISTVASGSLGITAGMTHSSSSQTMVISWVTNSTGGTTSFSTTSSSNGWSAFLTGNKLVQIPLVTTLLPGEYFLAHQHSSTASVTTGTNTSANNTTMMSYSHVALGGQTSAFSLGSFSSSGSIGSIFPGGFGFGHAASTNVVTNATMAGSQITYFTNTSAHNIYVNFLNA